MYFNPKTQIEKALKLLVNVMIHNLYLEVEESGPNAMATLMQKLFLQKEQTRNRENLF